MNIIKTSPTAIYPFVCGCILFLLGIFSHNLVYAQSFDEGLELYRRGDFRQAASVFDRMDTPQAQLFAGKCYFGLGQYLKAQPYLRTVVAADAPEDIWLEAVYTLALSQFQLNQFGEALEHLYALSQKQVRTQVVTDGIQFYKDILDYLTLEQRRQAFQSVSHPRIRYDLIRSAFGKVDYPTAMILLNEYKKTLAGDSLDTYARQLESLVSDSLDYAVEVTFGPQLQAPRGMTYNIGAALPRYGPSHYNFDVSQGLYYGYLFAVEEFNRRNAFKKAFLRYQNTGVNTDSSAYVMTDFAWNYQVDAVLGPLFSEPALKMARLAEQYQIPMLAPLANSDTLNIDNPYLYQANPTFASHGRKIAQYAVQDLEMDTIAVLAEQNSLGAVSAYAFREEAEKLGASVPYFFVEDLESTGYEMREYTKYFTADSAQIDSLGYHHLDGVYAPFTGQAAPTLINLLLIDLQAANSSITLLGSQKWGATDIPENLLQGQAIFFSESYYINNESDRLEQFRSNFTDRFGIEPNRFAMIGYDVADYLLRTLERVENPALLKNALKEQPLYEGLITDIRFDGTHINQEAKIFKISDQGVQPAGY